MKRLPLGCFALLPLLSAGCGDDPKPTHVEGSYTVSCDSGCSGGTLCFKGDHEEANKENCNGDWNKIYVVCTVNGLEGGAKSVTGYVSDQPLSVSNDAGRSGFQIDSSVVLDGVTDPYQITLWDPPGDFHVNSREPMDGQALCENYSVTLLSADSFQVDFDCSDMRTSFDLAPRSVDVGHIVFSHCD